MIAYRKKRPPLNIPTAGFSLGIIGRPIPCDAIFNPQRQVIRRIQRKVAEYYGLRPIEMVSARRARSVAWPRQVAMYLCRELTPHSLPSIGRHFGGRDHTTVMYAIKAVELRGGTTARDLLILRKLLGDGPVDNATIPQTMSNSLAEYGKEQGVNGQEEMAA